MNMFGGLLAFLGIYAGSAAKAAKDNYDMKKTTRTVDKDGNIYLIFSRKEAQEKLNLSDKTVTKAFKELSDCKLIYEKKQGRNNLI